MSKKITTGDTGLNFLEVLTIVFVVLKLTNLITWSWWCVLSPLWIPLAFIICCIPLIYYYVYYIKKD